MTAILVIDVGTTGLRAAIVDDTLTLRALEYRACPPVSPFGGLVEFDAADMAAKLLEAAHTVIDRVGEPITAVGITNQRASTLLWDRATGEPIGNGLGWQDLRTIGECLTAKAEHGWSIAPNQSVTKAAWLLANSGDLAGRDVCLGTVDSWIAWTLSGGASGGSLHISDQTNASATTSGFRLVDGSDWNDEVLDAFAVPRSALPTVVDSVGICGEATVLPGAPPIAGILGDQQASLVGQNCVVRGRAKITFGTGGMLDLCTDEATPHGIEPGRPRHLSPAAVVTRRRTHVGRRGDHALGRDEHRVAARRSRPHRHERAEPRRGERLRTHRRGGLRSGAALASAHRTGTTGRAAHCSASRGVPTVDTSFVRFWRASPIAAPTCSRPPKPTPASRSRRCASTAA